MFALYVNGGKIECLFLILSNHIHTITMPPRKYSDVMLFEDTTSWRSWFFGWMGLATTTRIVTLEKGKLRVTPLDQVEHFYDTEDVRKQMVPIDRVERIHHDTEVFLPSFDPTDKVFYVSFSTNTNDRMVWKFASKTKEGRDAWVARLSEVIHGLKTLCQFERLTIVEQFDATRHFPTTIVFKVKHIKTNIRYLMAEVTGDLHEDIAVTQHLWLEEQAANLANLQADADIVFFVYTYHQLFAFWENM